MQSKKKLLREIKTFLKDTGMAKSTFGQMAVKNHRLVKKLEDGGTISIDVFDQVRDYMSAERRRRRKKLRPIERIALALG